MSSSMSLQSQCMRARDALESRVRQGVAKGGTARHLVQDVLQFSLPIAARYKHLDIIRILQNCSDYGHSLEVLIHALSILERYGKNLLRSDRPSQWRVVRLSNQIFKTEVDIIQGAREILKLLGYTRTVEDGLAYPEDFVAPDIPLVASVTTDILLLRQELTMLVKSEHNQERDFFSYIPAEEIRQAQECYQQSIGKDSRPASVQAPIPLPPSYEDVLKGAGTVLTQFFKNDEKSNISPHVPQHIPPHVNGNLAEQNSSAQELQEEELCDICGIKPVHFFCSQCDNGSCEACDGIWHNNPKRRHHTRDRVPQIDHQVSESQRNGEFDLISLDPENVINNARTQSSHDPPVRFSQEEREITAQEQLPTVSGARLAPSLTSRTTSQNDNDWERKANRMATDLMDITDRHAKMRRLKSFLNELDTETSKYQAGIQQVNSSGIEKPSLIAHFQEKVDRIEGLKSHLKVLVGDDELVEAMDTRHSRHNSIRQDEDSWSFKSVKSQSSLPQNSFENIQDQQHSSLQNRSSEHINHLDANDDKYSFSNNTPSTSHNLNTTEMGSKQKTRSQPRIISPMQRLEESPTIPVAKLVDLSESPIDLSTSAPCPVDASGDHEMVTPSQSIGQLSGISNGSQEEGSGLRRVSSSTSSLKRVLPQSGDQPAKLTKGSLEPAGAMPEMATEFENMNIEPALGLQSSNVPEKNDLNSASGATALKLQVPRMQSEILLQSEPNSFDRGIPPSDIMGSAFQFGKMMDTFTPKDMQKIIKKEENRFQTTQFVDWIRAGNAQVHIPELVQVAVSELHKEGNLSRINPDVWIEKKWEEQIVSFIQYVKTHGMNVSKSVAVKHLLSTNNDFELALKSISDEQLELIENFQTEHEKEKVKHALEVNNGDKYYSACFLQREEVKSFFAYFDNHEDSADDECTHLQRTFAIENNERKSHSHAAAFSIPKPVSDTSDAVLAMLPEDMESTLIGDIVEASINFPGNCDAILSYLNNECMICTDKFPQNKIMCLPTCEDNECKYCLRCLQEHLAVCITDKNIRDIVCPVCTKPEYEDSELKTDFFNYIDHIVRRMDDKKIHEIFQQKMRDFTLMRMPNFRWCSHCSGGFTWEIDRENDMKMICPFCRKGTCFKCKKQWQPQHDGISCEQFQLWKESNDPEFQAAGLARHLKENGIDCPDCNFRYALAKGGCMHFKCTQCSHEFCSGCNRPFKHGRTCNLLRTCSSKGLHAHHPRDCLFYLRDCEPSLLQKLLKNKNIPFNTTGRNNGRCQVMEQKETSIGLQDDVCNREVENNSAGLCRLHYNEYLVNLVNTNRLDPADLYPIEQLRLCLTREDKAIPAKNARESNSDYRQRVLEEVKKLPLVKSITTGGQRRDL